MTELSVSSGISQTQGHVPKRENTLQLGSCFVLTRSPQDHLRVVRVIDHQVNLVPPQPVRTDTWEFLYLFSTSCSSWSFGYCNRGKDTSVKYSL